jgi:hypothetical protein
LADILGGLRPILAVPEAGGTQREVTLLVRIEERRPGYLDA